MFIIKLFYLNLYHYSLLIVFIMPKLDKTGPEGKGQETGRKLGNCKQTPFKELIRRLGRGMGKRRKSGGGEGKGKRLQYDS